MHSARQNLVDRIIRSGARLGGRSVSAVLEDLSRIADDLLEAGVEAGNIVVLEDLQGPHLLAVLLKVWQLDAIPVLCTKRPDLPQGGASFLVDKNFTVRAPESGIPTQGLETTALMHVSSGSTGKPKIVRRGVASVLAEAMGYRTLLPMAPEDNVIVPVPVVHSYGSGFALSALINGCTLDAEPVVRVSRLVHRIDSGASVVLALSAPLARLLADVEDAGAKPDLRVAMVGAGQVSEALTRKFAARFGVRLMRNYGSSETGAIMMGDRGIGRPIPGVEIIHPGCGEVGELQVSSVAPIEGCMADAETPATVWRTGDIVEYRRDGTIEFIERRRGALRINGRFIDAHAIENALRQVPGVDDVYLLVVARTGADEIDDFHAFVAGAAVESVKIDAALMRLSADMPRPRVMRCEKLPVNAIGKPDRAEMEKMAQKGVR
ncbi:AMP-binding protein [Streptomyces sp. 769]|uniref:class I adenylate-forming enzyme family protein n=1 Tax=Streptomyces sp. 769 TaxID=1262452 RepID=UPI00131EA027|nr:AMP-binding protein [Streptomyces sp. 769]